METNIILTEEAHDELYAENYAKKAKEPEPDAMGKDLKQSNGKFIRYRDSISYRNYRKEGAQVISADQGHRQTL